MAAKGFGWCPENVARGSFSKELNSRMVEKRWGSQGTQHSWETTGVW